MGVDVRWQQRADSFGRAVKLLRSALSNGVEVLNDLEKEGTAQRFEFSVELAWKTLKDYLEHSGVQLVPVTPKNVVKAAFSARLIRDGQLWVDMLNQRNLLSHDYDEARLGDALQHIHQRYLPAMEQLIEFFQAHRDA